MWPTIVTIHLITMSKYLNCFLMTVVGLCRDDERKVIDQWYSEKSTASNVHMRLGDDDDDNYGGGGGYQQSSTARTYGSTTRPAVVDQHHDTTNRAQQQQQSTSASAKKKVKPTKAADEDVWDLLN